MYAAWPVRRGAACIRRANCAHVLARGRLPVMSGQPPFAFYPTVGARVWVAGGAAGRWAGRVVRPPESQVGRWKVQQDEQDGGGGDSSEWVGWELLAPRALIPNEPPTRPTDDPPQRSPPSAAAPSKQQQQLKHRQAAVPGAVAVVSPTTPLPSLERGFTIASFNMLLSEVKTQTLNVSLMPSF